MVVLINMVTILIMSAKMATPGLRKIKVFWKKENFSTRDSNYIVNVVTWLKFGNSSISMREVIITSIL